jgi:alkylation response protein AidB-like acyl-CoA dehydrogenase
MELDLGPEIAQYRAELRDWIAAQTPPGLADLYDWNMVQTAGGRRGGQLARAMAHPAYQEWSAKLQAKRLICPQWPEEFGGQGLDAVRIAVLNEEFHPRAAGALPAQDHLRRGRVLPGLLRAEPRL